MIHVCRILDDVPLPVGTIDEQSGCFSYAPSYLRRSDARAISLALPLRVDPFSRRQTENYFDALLPEGAPRQIICSHLGIAEGRYLDLLAALGQDCLADLIITRGEPVYLPTYEAVELGIAASIADNPLLLTRGSMGGGSSLAGTKGKAGLAHDPSATSMLEGWFAPLGCAASTHILKVQPRHDAPTGSRRTIFLEHLCMSAAADMGICTVPTTLLPVGAGELLCIERYDRTITNAGGALHVQRIHQEDLTQVLGIPSASKDYELEGGSLHTLAQLLDRHSSHPAADIEQLARVTLFNYLIGNADAHLKNFSLLYSADWSSSALAPFYDLVSTTAFAIYSRDMRMAIGGVHDIDAIGSAELDAFAHELGTKPSMLRRLANDMLERFDPACKRAFANDATGSDLLWTEHDSLLEDMAPRRRVLEAYASGV